MADTKEAALGKFWMPEGASTIAEDVDLLFDFIYWLNVIFFLLIAVGTVYFVWKYRRKKEGQLALSQIDDHMGLETLWSVVPLLLCLVCFAWGFRIYMDLNVAPDDAYEIQAKAKRWNWAFQYEGVPGTTAELYVPVDKPVKLIMSSSDVLHSFFVPEFRVKQDVVPGRYTTLWFQATRTGKFTIFCTEYCGKDHSKMLADLHVLSQKDFDKRLADGFADPNAAKVSPAEGLVLRTPDDRPHRRPADQRRRGRPRGGCRPR